MSDQKSTEPPLERREDRIEKIVARAMQFRDLDVQDKYLADALWDEPDLVVKSVREIMETRGARRPEGSESSADRDSELIQNDDSLALDLAEAVKHPKKRDSGADDNLLFGIIALQMDFIDRDQLISAMNTWVLEKSKPLGKILCDQKAISHEVYSLLGGLVRKHLEIHENDPTKSLASLSSIGSIRHGLQEIGDSDLEASLGYAAAHKAQEDPDKTLTRSIGGAKRAGGRYQILRPHASGGLGEVFVATDAELNREVALKEIKARYSYEQEFRERFVLEAEITGGLEHPGVVPVYGLGHYSDGRPFYAMRFIRGHSLREEINRFHSSDLQRDAGFRELGVRKLLGRFVDVCDAIAYAHSRGILHRDLKPGNVMLGKYGETLVVDWGLAKSVSQPDAGLDSDESALRPSSGSDSAPTQSGVAIGTLPYMSPEQAAGRLEEIGVCSDIYNLGATLYHLLVGRAPHKGDDFDITVEAIKDGRFLAPRQADPRVPRALDAICLKAMALSPDDRYLSAQALAEDVENWLAGEIVTAYDEPMFDRAKRFVRRHPALSSSLAVMIVCVCLAGFAAFAVWQRIQQSENELALESQQREAAEALESQKRETARVFAIRTKCEEFEGTAIQELRSGRFAAAREHMGQAVASLENESELTELRHRMESIFRRATQLERFHRLGEQAEEMVFFGSATEPILYLQEAFQALDVFQSADWWAHLPDNELTAKQIDRLRNDVYRRLVLLSALRVKQSALRQRVKTFLAILAPRMQTQYRRFGESVSGIGSVLAPLIPSPVQRLVASISPQDHASLRSALATGRMARRFRSSQSLTLGRNYCQFLLGEAHEPLRVPRWQAENATDSYVMSSVLLDFFQRMPPAVTLPIKLLRVSEPIKEARTMLQDASYQEPDNYWVHVMLGKCEEELKDFDGARAACGRCISIDPDNWLGYMRRAQVSLAEIRAVDDVHQRSQLLKQSLRDIERARDLQPNSAEIHWYLGNALREQSEQTDHVVNAYTQAIELEKPTHQLNDLGLVKIRRSRLLEIQQFARSLCNESTDNPDYLVLLALVELALDRPDNAMDAAEKSLNLRADDSRALAVRATLELQRGHLENAIDDFQRATDNPLTLLGLGAVFEKQEKYERALRNYHDLFRVARTRWRKADAHLSRSRVLLQLGREDQALQALEQALEINLAVNTRELEKLARSRKAMALVHRLSERQASLQPVVLIDSQIFSIPLLNGDFELGPARYWSVWENLHGCQSSAQPSSHVRRSAGKTSLYLENRSRRSAETFGFMSQAVSIDPNEIYRMTVWAKSEGYASGGLAVHVDELRVIHFRAIPSEWTLFSEEFVIPSSDGEPKRVEVKIQFSDEGQVWLDDVAIDRVIESSHGTKDPPNARLESK